MMFSKKIISNSLILIFVGAMLYPPSKEFIIRLVSFSPSVIEQVDREVLSDYNWSLKGLNTESVKGKELRNNVFLINFWATWCPPCRAELSSMQKLYDDYKNKVKFIFVTNENWSDVDQFYKTKGYNLPTYGWETSVPEILKSSSIPQTYIINSLGEIVVSKNGAANWNSLEIRKLLEKLTY
ncbi:MAG TPA: thiol-disulfide oxidoreductase [Tenacibaculum sp.]|nr:thiol-disulfide oxidoreductase [Tenacibaculum sp.]